MMQSVKLRSHVGKDGILKLEIPLNLVDTDLEIMVVFQPVTSTAPGPEDSGWPANFFEQTYGSFRTEPLIRESEGEYETREDLE
jgi:hypothetical protein